VPNFLKTTVDVRHFPDKLAVSYLIYRWQRLDRPLVERA